MERKRRSIFPPHGNDHPTDLDLAMAAAGLLDKARVGVVIAHICGCASCRFFVRSMENIGGIMLENLPPTPLADGSITKVIARLNSDK